MVTKLFLTFAIVNFFYRAILKYREKKFIKNKLENQIISKDENLAKFSKKKSIIYTNS